MHDFRIIDKQSAALISCRYGLSVLRLTFALRVLGSFSPAPPMALVLTQEAASPGILRISVPTALYWRRSVLSFPPLMPGRFLDAFPVRLKCSLSRAKCFLVVFYETFRNFGESMYFPVLSSNRKRITSLNNAGIVLVLSQPKMEG